MYIFLIIDVKYMRTTKGSKMDTERMRNIGANFDWGLKLWYVPSDTELTEVLLSQFIIFMCFSQEYSKYLLPDTENESWNKIHDEIMETVEFE